MTDLTRWNRAGLSRFRYVDANAATHLEVLRAGLASAFPDWEGVQQTVPADESAGDRNDRLLEHYYADRRDLVREIARAFARACYVLTEHLDATANEGYLGTATQWENVRRLVRMLDYSPAPPASASTYIVIEAKQATAGTLEAGFQVKHAPADGSAPVVFETLEDIPLDPAVNELRLSGWSYSAAPLSAALWPLADDQDVRAGQTAVLLNQTTAQAAAERIAAVDGGAVILPETAGEGQPDWPVWAQGAGVLLAGPVDIRAPRLNGNDVSYADSWTGLSVGDVIAWPVAGAWHVDEVVAVESGALRLKSQGRIAASTPVYRLVTIGRNPEGDLILSGDGAMFRRVGSTLEQLDSPASEPYKFGGVAQGAYITLTDSSIDEVLLLGDGAAPLATTSDAPSALTFDGSPGQLAGGDWVVVETAGSPGSRIWAALVEAIEEEEDAFSVTFADEPWGDSEILRVHGPFKYSIRPAAYDRSSVALTGASLTLDGGALPDLLLPGKVLILEKENAARDGFEGAVKATVVSTSDDGPTVILDRSFTADEGFTLGNTAVRANAVKAGHGAARPQKVLGSGNATKTTQSFTLEVPGISFVEDPAFAAGVRADVEVTVGSMTWTQVDSLNESEPEDAHCEVRIDEDGYLLFTFGDGTHARRLPTGSSNVRVYFRVGAGLAGNLDAGNIDSVVRPSPLVQSVRQPLAAAGGAEAETADALRQNAPASVLTLGRAVSLDDFANLAAGLSSVWQAAAFESPAGRRGTTLVEVVVVPAGGGELGDLADSIRATLESHALPGVRIEVRRFTEKAFTAEVTIRVDSSAFDPEPTRLAVIEAVRSAFTIEQRRLGQPLYLSELISVVEAVEGVENADCVLNADTTIQRIDACGRCVVYLDEADDALTVVAEEFSL